MPLRASSRGGRGFNNEDKTKWDAAQNKKLVGCLTLNSSRQSRPGRCSASSSWDCSESFEDILGDLETGEARLWAAVILTAWKDRRWRYFLDPGTTFPLAAACCKLDVGAAVRAAVKARKRG